MRFFLIFSGCLLLTTLPTWGQEVAIDLSIARLSPRAVQYEPNADWGNNYHVLLAEQTEVSQEASQLADLKTTEETLDHRKLRYWKIREIVLNAPAVRPHFLVKSKLPRRSGGTKKAHQDRETLDEIISKLKIMY